MDETKVARGADPVEEVLRMFRYLTPGDRMKVYERVTGQVLGVGAEACETDHRAGNASVLANYTPGGSGRLGRIAEEISLENCEDLMRYQPWDQDQIEHGEQIREALVFAMKAILRNAPRSPRRTLALQHIVSARMDVNAAISFRGRF